MMGKGLKYILLVVFFQLSLIASAQKTRTVSGEYTYCAPSDITLDQAKHTALSRIKQQLIAETFGTRVQVSNSTSVVNKGEVSSTDFISTGSSEIKGEWIETIGEPRYDIRYEQQMLVVTVSVKGKVREIIDNKVCFNSSVLKNGIEPKYEANEFRNGDDLFLSFKSPSDGFLMVYLYDGSQVCRLLPYESQNVDALRVEADRQYVFFSAKNADYGVRSSDIDEYSMTCRGESEINSIYVLFSTKSFLGVCKNASDRSTIEYKAFRQWLTDTRVRNLDIQIEIKDILVRK